MHNAVYSFTTSHSTSKYHMRTIQAPVYASFPYQVWKMRNAHGNIKKME